jgi:hypothetical protein
MPTILELFKKSKEAKQIPQTKPSSGTPQAGQLLLPNVAGKVGEKFFDPLNETLFEEELTGLRPQTAINQLTLYGTDILRITSQKTSDVDAMILSKNPDAQISLGKIGKFIQKVGDTANKLLGVPQHVFPTYVIGTKEFKESKTPNRMVALGQIKKDARGSALGRFLISTGAGTPNQIAKQSIGQGINLAKDAMRSALIGSQTIPVTSGSLDNFNQKYYYSNGEFEGNYSYSMKGVTQPAAGSSYDISNVSITKIGFDAKDGLFGNALRFANKSTYAFQLSENSGHKKFGEPTQVQLSANYNTPTKTGKSMGPYGTDGKKLDDQNGGLLKSQDNLLNFIRPKSLNRGNWKKDRYSTNNTKTSISNLGKSTYSNKLDTKRGIFSTKDVINQTGRLTKDELKSVKYNGKTLDEVDLVPLRFQKLNDGSGVYFRSIVTGYNEDIEPAWESSKMLGSPFNFYSYTGVERKLRFNMKIYAMSQAELVLMWRRIEYLSHCAYPHTYNNGIIEPTILYFTFGNVYTNKACFLDSITYAIEDAENLWELGGGQLQVKEGNFEDGMNNRFFVGHTNDSTSGTFGVSKGIGGSYDKLNMDWIKEGENEVAKKNGNSYISNITNKKNKVNVNTANVNMDNYKLPKFINASVGLTFIETKGTTDQNIYGYGKKIGTGI